MTATTQVQRAKPEHRWGERITRALEYLAAIGTTLMMLHILANVVGRSAANQPVTGTNEWVGYIWLPAIVMIGFVVAVVRGQTIDADIVYQRLPIRLRREVRCFTSALSAVVCVGFTWYSAQEAMHSLSVGTKAPASDIYIAPIFILPPLAFAALTVLFAVDSIKAIRGAFDDESFDLTDAEGADLLKELERD